MTHSSWNNARSLSTRGLLPEPRNFLGLVGQSEGVPFQGGGCAVCAGTLGGGLVYRMVGP